MPTPASPTRAVVGLQTSGKQLQVLLEKSGARHRLEGAEKLDFLVWLADQVKGSIEDGRRMKLELSDLTGLLQKEGVPGYEGRRSFTDVDAKAAVSGLLALRRREIARLGYDVGRASGDDSFEQTLLGLSAAQVAGCFETALVPYDANAASSVAAEAPPGSAEPEGDSQYFKCEFDCGFVGSHSEVAAHERTCEYSGRPIAREPVSPSAAAQSSPGSPPAGVRHTVPPPRPPPFPPPKVSSTGSEIPKESPEQAPPEQMPKLQRARSCVTM